MLKRGLKPNDGRTSSQAKAASGFFHL
jgi:hypothetical protein